MLQLTHLGHGCGQRPRSTQLGRQAVILGNGQVTTYLETHSLAVRPMTFGVLAADYSTHTLLLRRSLAMERHGRSHITARAFRPRRCSGSLRRNDSRFSSWERYR